MIELPGPCRKCGSSKVSLRIAESPCLYLTCSGCFYQGPRVPFLPDLDNFKRTVVAWNDGLTPADRLKRGMAKALDEYQKAQAAAGDQPPPEWFRPLLESVEQFVKENQP